MPGMVRYPALDAMASFIDSPDSVYGTGNDGSATMDGSSIVIGVTPSANVYTMARDVYFYNLTINAGVRLNPNGYRVFVKNQLTLGASTTIGYTSGFGTAGSIQQGGAVDTAVTHSLGGASQTRTATAPTAALGGSQYFQQPLQAIDGFSVTAAGGPTFLRGGAGGVGRQGGGVIILSARYISGPTTGTATISAKATSPGGGGVILIVSSGATLPASVTTDVTGFAAGTVNYMQLV
jgi:hypothetical protein